MLTSGPVKEVARLKCSVIAVMEVVGVKCIRPSTVATDDTQDFG